MMLDNYVDLKGIINGSSIISNTHELVLIVILNYRSANFIGKRMFQQTPHLTSL